MKITEWPFSQRPRERLLADGVEKLSDAELLAIFIHTGSNGRNAIEIAQELLVKFDGIHGLTQASQSAFCAGKGLGPAKWAVLQAAGELTRRALQGEIRRGSVLDSPKSVRAFLSLWLRHRPAEVFVGLFLDNQNHLLAADELFRGTLSQTAVYPREIVRRAIELNAGAVIFAHNHPSGLAEPSRADRLLTDSLRSALAQLEIRVLDHLVIAGNQTTSFAERGYL